ncbi:MAG: hypothetical protein QXH55_03105 [Candidatus Korarchaeota archaeon]|nr:hypothetical protein [Thermoproteota archaeon]MCR8463148.1 hypothetical protein [Thermoproteota archaeon]MCR8471023.1 hypothetical protein [Thermoproteota archaeon]MCR8471839.1 hypothetical protein [Thermoproteota archaeon]MCR8472815.1 hypothetical protein [Thermoproteota archaeon]
MAVPDYICPLLALIGVIDVQSESFTKREIINPSVPLLASLLFEDIVKHDENQNYNSFEAINFEHKDYEVWLEFDRTSFLWSLDVKYEHLEVRASIIYPCIDNFLNFCKYFFSYLKTRDTISPLTINSYLKEVLPYKLHYLVKINNQLLRFSELVLEEMSMTKSTPSQAIRKVINLKPKIVDTNFSSESLEKSFILTYLVLRSELPAYLLPRPNRINKDLYRNIHEILQDIYGVEVILLESIEKCIDFLSLVAQMVIQPRNK